MSRHDRLAAERDEARDRLKATQAWLTACAAERDEAIALLREVTVTDTGQGAAIDAFLHRAIGSDR